MMPTPEFPKTPHIVWLGESLKDDKILAKKEIKLLLNSNIIVQEKVDGNCVGFSYNSSATPTITHRGGQVSANDYDFKHLHTWYQRHEDKIFDLCGEKYGLFGEWLYWHHTVHYNKLPSLFMVHDIYDRENKYFLPTKIVSELTKQHGLTHNPVIFEGKSPSLDKLIKMHIKPSQFADANMEGIYVRIDTPEKNVFRAKIVSREFHEIINHSPHWRERHHRLQNKSVNIDEQYLFHDKTQ